MRSHPASEDLQQCLSAVRLNLARALVRAGQHGRAAGLYGQLVAGGTLPDGMDLPERAADWLGFGHALAGSGQLPNAESAFQRAMSPAAPMQVCCSKPMILPVLKFSPEAVSVLGNLSDSLDLWLCSIMTGAQAHSDVLSQAYCARRVFQTNFRTLRIRVERDNVVTLGASGSAACAVPAQHTAGQHARPLTAAR